ncbi:MAG: amidase [Deltaproteobacteria bacterium]|nr:amidase [Deltaproteobacteria bacterium]
MNELLGLTLIELTEAIKTRKASPVELMEAILSRVEETNTDLNAVVAMRDREALMKDAVEAEKRVMDGQARPLEGIPFGVKDLEDVQGLVTSMGSLPFRDQVAERDSTQVARLKAAGGIVFGKTNAPEFGYTAITKNLVYGVTRSPWNLERTPGGSSGGSSAAMTGCVLPLVTGSDGGGSVRIPASFTGAFGLKPSFGRIPTGPKKTWIYGDTVAYGPITKTVEDGALFMDQVVGPSPCDPDSLPHPGISYLEAVRRPLPKSLRIGYSPDLGYAVVQSDVATEVEEGTRVFEKMGHKIEEVKQGPPDVGREWGLMGSFEIAAQLYPLLPEHEEDFGRSFIAGVKAGWNMTPEWWGEAARKRAQLNNWCAEIFDQYDLLITPTVPYDPPPAKGPFPTEIEGRKQGTAGVATFTIPFNLSWHPAATVRVGLSKTGLPIGLQIVGPRHRDDLVLQAARAFEVERPWHPDWPTSWQALT